MGVSHSAEFLRSTGKADDMVTMSSTNPAATLALAFAAAACGGGAAASGAAATRENNDPCSLITEAEAEAILSADLTVRPGTAAGPPTCEYAPTSRRLNGFTLTVYWRGGRGALDVAKQGYSLATEMIQGEGRSLANMLALEPVPGVGDEAWFNPAAGTMVLQGEVLLEFDIRGMMWHQKYESGRELWKQLATRAVTRLADAKGS